MDELTDRDLLVLSRDGHPEAFGVLFERYARAVYNFCFRATADWATAEDLTSVVFLEAWRRRDTEIEGERALPWLLGVSTNVVRNHRRALRRYRAALRRIPPPDAAPDPAEDLAPRLDDQRRMRAVLDALAGLSPLDRDVLSLVVWSGLSYEEAAAALGVAVGTVRSRLARARARLRELTRAGGHPSGEVLTMATRERTGKENG
jgi:RNA polymerase sigma-70 factor (ECF subfamily)